MKKFNEDWFAVLVAFVLIVLALLHVISPAWMKF